MNTNETQNNGTDSLEQRASKVLDQGVDDLDELTCIQLSAARKRALAQPVRSWNWGIPAGLATAVSAILVIALWFGAPSDSLPNTPLDDLELLTTTESLDLLEEFEFYQWLDAEDVVAG
ncbi:hypothetical protein [Sedimenticola selenatireducens]|uniref:DUF3619 family protein n=1 Tax=Sedimenticola selenatireducens TaxID=191960 RepID=A0A557S0L7_9GAMM|nr:hypothetical protein [Sedimenticola selenatireducens]TVO70975.1 hypothetical protein FHP88_16125 [Sedimenticola selenatireducens]TVT65841.1 MAG: hypothetical protein FHK78_03815 [Sedimenticola selenatireducens]